MSELPAQVEEALPSAQRSLVELAIDKGVDVEIIERLVALQERVTERNARSAYFRALADFQAACPEIAKTATASIATRSGSGYGYSYAPLPEITRTIREPLRQCELSYSWDVAQGEGDVLLVTCILRHVEGHEERSAFPVPVDTKAAMSGAQKNGAALTYGRRQSLIAVLGLTTADGDSDALPESAPDPITDQALADLEALIDETGADRAKFLRFLGVERLGDLPQARVREAVAALERKRGKP